MKKILLGTTALVLLSGAAAAQQVTTKSPFTVSINGSIRYNFALFDQDSTNVNRESAIDTRILLKAEAKADNGLTYGYRARLRVGAAGAGSQGLGLDQSAIYASGSWGAVYLGDDSDARTQLEVLAPVVGIGQADQAGFLAAGFNTMYWATEGNWATKATYMTPSFSGFQAGVSYTPEFDTDRAITLPTSAAGAAALTDWVDVGAAYTGNFGQVGVKVGAGIGFGADRNRTDGDTYNWNVGAQVSYAGFTFGGYYWDDNATFGAGLAAADSNRVSYGLGLTYATGPWAVGASWVQTNTDVTGSANDGRDTIYGIGGAYSLAPGLSLQADALYLDAETNSGNSVNGNEGFGVVFRTRVDF